MKRSDHNVTATPPLVQLKQANMVIYLTQLTANQWEVLDWWESSLLLKV